MRRACKINLSNATDHRTGQLGRMKHWQLWEGCYVLNDSQTLRAQRGFLRNAQNRTVGFHSVFPRLTIKLISKKKGTKIKRKLNKGRISNNDQDNVTSL